MKRGGRGGEKKKFGTTSSPVTADSTYTPIRRGNVVERVEKGERSEKLTSAGSKCSSKCFHKPVGCGSKSGNWANIVRRSVTRSGWSEHKATWENKETGGGVPSKLGRRRLVRKDESDPTIQLISRGLRCLFAALASCWAELPEYRRRTFLPRTFLIKAV